MEKAELHADVLDRTSQHRTGLVTHRMCISMGHQDCEVSQVTAGAGGVSLVSVEEFAALC